MFFRPNSILAPYLDPLVGCCLGVAGSLVDSIGAALPEHFACGSESPPWVRQGHHSGVGASKDQRGCTVCGMTSLTKAFACMLFVPAVRNEKDLFGLATFVARQANPEGPKNPNWRYMAVRRQNAWEYWENTQYLLTRTGWGPLVSRGGIGTLQFRHESHQLVLKPVMKICLQNWPDPAEAWPVPYRPK